MLQRTISRRRLMAMAGAGALGAAVSTGFKAQLTSAAVADEYELIDLGLTSPVAEVPMSVLDMNNHGVAVGSLYVDAEKNAPWYSDGGELVRIKTGKFGARLSCINDDGVIGGRELLGWHTPVQPFGRPALWIDGEKQVMPFPEGLPSPAEEGVVIDINNAGDAIGTVSVAGGATFPVVWRGDAVEVLELPEGSTGGRPYSIDESGAILGTLSGDVLEDSVYWTMFGLEYMSYQRPVGFQGGFSGFHFSSMDQNGRVLGRFVQDEVEVGPAYLPANGSQLELLPQIEGVEYSYAERSDGGNIFAGSAMINGKETAAIWTGGVGSLLKDRVKNTRGLRLESVVGITPDGQIAVRARNKDGGHHAVLLMPA